MTNPRDDLMALADRLRELVFRQGQIDWDALIKIEIDLRLAASRPAPFDREAVARIIKNHVSVTVSGNAYAPRDNDRDGVASAADAILSLLHPAEPVEAKQRDTWSAAKHDEIIKRLMEQVGMPNSRSLYQAFKQFANELHYLAIKESPPKSPDISEAIDLLTDGEGDTITFCAPNPDFNGLPNECVTINASWTDWHDRDFRADTRQECLRDAIEAMRETAIRQLPTPERGDES